MANYVDLSGVRTWYDVHGTGEPLVLFHPGGVGVDTRTFGPNLADLAAGFCVYTPERRGHGHTPDVDGPYHYDALADDMIRFIEQIVDGPARLAGVSDGAIVALTVAKKRPDLVERLVCVAGIFHVSGRIKGTVNDLEPPEFMIAGYKQVTPDPKDHFQVVAKKLHHLHTEGPKFTPADLADITCRTLVMTSDDDVMTLEHAIAFYQALPHGELAVVPGTSHGLLLEKPDLCNKILIDFLTLRPVATYAPIRRV